MAAVVFLAPGPFGAGGQFMDQNGVPLALGQITTYLAGTTNPGVTYTSSAGTIPNANPIILNPDGRPPQEIWIPQGVAMKFVLADVLGTIIQTYDNLSGVNDQQSITSEWIPLGLTPTFISATQFSVPGAPTVLVPGRRLQSVNTSGTVYNSIASVSFALGTTTVTIVQKEPGDGLLDSGLSSVNYGILAPANPSNPGLVDIQIFTANGVWTKPPNARTVDVEIIGGGASGGSASLQTAGNTGGGGGGGGAHARGRFNATDLAATVNVVVGASVAGPAGTNVGGTGTNGVAGNPSSFGSMTAFGGGAGGAGVVTGGATPTGGSGGGTGGAGQLGQAGSTAYGGLPQPFQSLGILSVLFGVGGGGGGGGSTGLPAEWGGGGGGAGPGAQDGTVGGNSLYGGAGGGGGGAMSAGTQRNGGQGGGGGFYEPGTGHGGAAGAAGGSNGGAGAAGTSLVCGSGGGGGGSFNAGAGGSGGAGGAPGGGGGGGAVGSTVGGAGGAGARGEVRVYTYF